jgi:hypothetical protein
MNLNKQRAISSDMLTRIFILMRSLLRDIETMN